MKPGEVQSWGRIPVNARRRFAHTKGVPPLIIAEMFARIDLAGDIRQAFWNALSLKDANECHGFVESITLDADGTFTVTLDGQDFYTPDDISEEAFRMFRDAFERHLSVDVTYQVDKHTGDITIVNLTVHAH